MYVRCMAGAIVLIFVSSAVWAQQTTGNLEGRVLGADGIALPAVNITVSGPAIQGTRGAATDDAGNFRVLALPVGSVTAEISHIAHQDIRLENIAIRLGQTTTLGQVSLDLRSIELSQVVITSPRPPIDPTTSTVGTNLSFETVEALPLERNFRAIAAVAPQANTSYFGDEVNISGSTGIENEYYIDGVNATDPLTAKTSTTLPYNFIKEIQIKTGGYEAEFRSALGGVINVVTHSGGNDFHGQIFGFFTNNGLSQSRRLGTAESQIGDFSESDVGFSLGGPIIRDRLWFFFAYDASFQTEHVEIPGFGFQEDKRTTHIFAGKLTWKTAKRTSVIFSVFGDPNSHTQISSASAGFPALRSLENLDPLQGDASQGGTSLSLQARHILTDNVLLEADISQTDREENNLPSTIRGEEPLFIDIQQGLWSGGRGFFQFRNTTRTETKVRSTLFIDNHTIKAGLEFEEGSLEGESAANVIFGLSDTLFRTVRNGRTRGKVKLRTPGVFLQDSWLVNNSLRINLGLRWGGQYFLRPDGKVTAKLTDYYQPRIGLVFQPSEIGSQKVFASYGRFYEYLPTFLGTFDRAGFQIITLFDHDPRGNPAGGDTVSVSLPDTDPAPPDVLQREGQYFDEFTMGYERKVANDMKFGIKGIFRNLGQAVEDGFVPGQGFVAGNPGEGKLSILPKFKRKYLALELTLEKSNNRTFNFLLSYVLSRNRGNYGGLFNSETGLGPIPNISRSLDYEEQIPNSDGLLPNDRTHSFKFNSSYKSSFGLVFGTSFLLQSGTPLTEFGGTSAGLPWQSFLSKRGDYKRTPAIWDLSVRISYTIPRSTFRFQPKLILDLLHLGSEREVVNVDQSHFTGLDQNGSQTGENPNFGLGTAFQPPMTVRLGLEVGF